MILPKKSIATLSKSSNILKIISTPRAMREWAVNSKPWFLAAKFIEAAEVFKTERIKLPADANIEEDDMLFPTICLAKLKSGRNVQEVAAAP